MAAATRSLSVLRLAILSAFLAWFFPARVRAQQAPPAENPSSPRPAPPEAAAPSVPGAPAAPPALAERKRAVHRFWDRQNCWLFAGVGASRALDFASTRNARRRGLNEILLNNDVVDNRAAFAVIEAAGTATSMAVSYWFHRAGHHRLERWTSYVHIGVATFGSARNYALKTPHPAVVP